jgi:transposase InsO family protein
MSSRLEQHDARIDTVLFDNGREFCGRHDQHPYELFPQLEEIEHRTTRVKRPQSNGVVEWLHRTLLDERFRGEGRRTSFETIEEVQAVLDEYLAGYIRRHPHQGCGRTAGHQPGSSLKISPTRNRKRRTSEPKRKPLSKPPDARSNRHCQSITRSVHIDQILVWITLLEL